MDNLWFLIDIAMFRKDIVQKIELGRSDDWVVGACFGPRRVARLRAEGKRGWVGMDAEIREIRSQVR